MDRDNEYEMLFEKLEDAVAEQEEYYSYSYAKGLIENESIRELAKICNQIDDETINEEYNSFTRS